METRDRIIVSAIIITKDGKILMGTRPEGSTSAFPGYWHIPGGGIEPGETFEQALLREVREEAGLDISNEPRELIPIQQSAIVEKIDKISQEKYLCNMHFNRFIVRIDKNADDIPVKPGSDIGMWKWLTPEEIRQVNQMPGGKEFFEKLGLI